VAIRRWRAASVATSNCRSSVRTVLVESAMTDVWRPKVPRLTRSTVTRAFARSPTRWTISRSVSMSASRASMIGREKRLEASARDSSRCSRRFVSSGGAT
jgi:hypothetical protein